MEKVENIDSALPEVEIAYALLKLSNNQGRNLRELMQEVFAIKGMPLDNPQNMAAVHTEITLDNRFNFLGQGNWGLKEWTQEKIVRRNISHAGMRSLVFHRRSIQDEFDCEEKETPDK
jgi:DNA-directed RNA polymerase subunit delta